MDEANPVLSLADRKRVHVGIISDTHGYLDERVLGVVNECDVIVHAGDIGNARVLDELEAPITVAVYGNNDTPFKWPDQEHGRLAQLDEQATVDLPGGRLAVVHGHRHGPAARMHGRLRKAFPQARAVVYGHTHRLVRDCEATPWLLNPGAAGRARTFGGPSCIVVTATPRGWEVVDQRFPLSGSRRARHSRRGAGVSC